MKPKAAPRQFRPPILEALRAGKMLLIRAGRDHRFTGVWVVVVDNRVFIRSWNDRPGGWYRAFVADPLGAMLLPSGKEIRVRARTTRAERVIDAVDDAYAAKYVTPASLRYVRGFARSRRRRATTTELMPR